MAAGESVELMNKRYEEAFCLIKYVLGVEGLCDNQGLIEAFVNGQNIFFSAPTGYGKSIVYQSLPWVFDTLNSLNEQTIGIFSTLIVISPLQSLMKINASYERDWNLF
jgi:superfamily II DNA helicase RecQ